MNQIRAAGLRRTDHPEGRPTCLRCFRPSTHCLCALVPRFAAHCNLVVLQHPHERKKYYSTSKLLSCAITNLTVLRGITFSDAELDWVFGGKKSYLLYPHSDAKDCETVLLDDDCCVVALDGTWIEARKLLYRNPRLKTLPYLSFKRPLRSNYRIRKQPRDHCLSTIESIGYLLQLNAHAQGKSEFHRHYEGLMQGFEQMINHQLTHVPEVRS